MMHDNEHGDFFNMCICGECLNQIMAYGHPSYIIFKDVLKATLNGGSFVLENNPENEDFYEVIKFLESKRYIITTEVSKDEIGIITNYTSAYFDIEKNYLCWCEQPSFSLED